MSLSHDDRLELAARWLVRSQDKNFTSEDQNMLDIWLKQDHANREAFEEMSKIWKHVGSIEHIFTSDIEHEHQEVFAHHRKIKAQSGLKNLVVRFLGANKKALFAYTGIAMMLLFCLLVFKAYFSEPFEMFYAYTTAIGKQKNVTLSDGSILRMNVDTSLFVRMSKHHRKVEIRGGEVFFEVRPDSDRPFEVHTSNSIVRVLGTTFNIKDRRNSVNIDVDHGRVQVNAMPKGFGDMRVKQITLVSGQGVDINTSGQLERLRSSNIKEVLAWQRHQIIFKNTPLSKVLRELELYHNVKINLAYQVVGKKCVTGTFDMHNLEHTLEIIAMVASLKIEKKSDSSITLYKE